MNKQVYQIHGTNSLNNYVDSNNHTALQKLRFKIASLKHNPVYREATIDDGDDFIDLAPKKVEKFFFFIFVLLQAWMHIFNDPL